jgi:hypothetical protein
VVDLPVGHWMIQSVSFGLLAEKEGAVVDRVRADDGRAESEPFAVGGVGAVVEAEHDHQLAAAGPIGAKNVELERAVVRDFADVHPLPVGSDGIGGIVADDHAVSRKIGDQAAGDSDGLIPGFDGGELRKPHLRQPVALLPIAAE